MNKLHILNSVIFPENLFCLANKGKNWQNKLIYVKIMELLIFVKKFKKLLKR